MGIARGWEKRVIRTNITYAKRTVRIFSVSPQSRSLFSASFDCSRVLEYAKIRTVLQSTILVSRVRRFLDTWSGYKLSRVALGTRMVWLKIANIAHALPVPVCRQTLLTPKRVVVSRLHDNVARFRTGVKFSPWYNNRGELTPGWLASAWHFVVVSCKQI